MRHNFTFFSQRNSWSVMWSKCSLYQNCFWKRCFRLQSAWTIFQKRQKRTCVRVILIFINLGGNLRKLFSPFQMWYLKMTQKHVIYDLFLLTTHHTTVLTRSTMQKTGCVMSNAFGIRSKVLSADNQRNTNRYSLCQSHKADWLVPIALMLHE